MTTALELFRRSMRDALEKAVPSDNTDFLYGHQNEGQLFSLCTEDVFSEVITGGSPLNQWIPARGTNTWNENVGHITWVAPEGFTGSTTYMDYLAAADPIGECDYGTGFDYNICEYTHQMRRVSFSNKNKPINRQSVGMKQCERMPQLRVRGSNSGIALDNDADWSVARLAIGMEQHLNWNTIHGDQSAAENMYDGLDNIISTNWVRSKAVGPGSCDFTDPLIVNGIALDGPEQILRTLKAMIRKIRMRMFERGYLPAVGDMAIAMSSSHWMYISDAIACGALTGSCNLDNLSLQITPEVWQREKERVTSGGLGFGFLDIDGRPIPVIPDNTVGANVTLGDGAPGVVGDIYVLTRRFRGINILEQQYLNWNNVGDNPVPNASVTMQNGMIRTTWVDENGKDLCFWYAVEMFGRIMSLMQPFQAKLTDVVVETELVNENESGSFASQDFYAYNGQLGGAGVARIAGL
jgi:hypothetical protein